MSKSFAAMRSQWVLFNLFPRVGASQAGEFQIATTTTPRKTVQTTFCTVICIFSTKSMVSPNPWKHRYLHCFLQFFHVPMPLANSNIYMQNSFKNNVFYNGFTMLSVNNTVIYTFFGIKLVQNTGFCCVFNALASKHLSKYRYLQCFSFLSVLPLPEAYQNDPKFHRKISQT